MFSAKHIKTFSRSEDGTVAILWAMGLVVFLAVLAATFDIGKVGVTRNELQSFTDNVALVAAGELDGRSDSITRATNAANALISDTLTFSEGDLVLSGSADYTLTFYSELPADDTTALGSTGLLDPLVPDNQPLAVFARVQAEPSTVSMIFLQAVNALLGNGTAAINTLVSTESVAGFTQEACDVAPLMFCLPDINYTADAHIGDMVQLRAGGNGAAWGPGNFGFLDPNNADWSGTCADENGNQEFACLIAAQVGVTQCYRQNGVDTEPGQKNGLTNAAFNVRFDLFDATFNNDEDDIRFMPAPNIIAGYDQGVSGTCLSNNPSPPASTNSVGLPRDDCFSSALGCTPARFGDGNWDLQSYLDWNYGTFDAGGVPIFESGGTTADAIAAMPAGYPAALASTRYGIYLREIARGGASGDILTGRDESGRAQCAPDYSSNPARRTLIVAGVDCVANGIQGSTENVPVEEYFQVFLTEPVGDDGSTNPPTLDIWGEIIGSAGGDGYGAAGDGGIFRDVVQLYR